jgi:hypothetical protein
MEEIAVQSINARHERHFLKRHLILTLAPLAFAAMTGWAHAEDIAMSCRIHGEQQDRVVEISNKGVLVDGRLQEMAVDKHGNSLHTEQIVITSRTISFTIVSQLAILRTATSRSITNIDRITGDLTIVISTEGGETETKKGKCVKALDTPRKS